MTSSAETAPRSSRARERQRRHGGAWLCGRSAGFSGPLVLMLLADETTLATMIPTAVRPARPRGR